MSSVRPPAVAGSFYPADPDDLSQTLAALLAGVARPAGGPPPKALVVPHAGYRYSGPAAAVAYRRIEPHRTRYRRVLLLGPVHRVSVRGLALPGCAAFATPLGVVPVVPDLASLLADLPQVSVRPDAHAAEHSLEVQLPFLQTVLGPFDLVPLAVGDASPAEVARVLDRLRGGPETLIVVSTDLSHYHPYSQAADLDQATAAAILGLQPVTPDRACGAFPLNGFLLATRARGLTGSQAALNNSGDTAGDRARVVGYGSFVFTEPEAP